MKAKCWLIGEAGRGWRSHFQTASRGSVIEVCRCDDVPNIPAAPGTLIAIDFECLGCLTPLGRTILSKLIRAGATCYIGGAWPADAQYSLAPLASVNFRVAVEDESPGYSLSAHPLLPAGLRYESVPGCYRTPVARGLSDMAEPLVLMPTRDGSMAPPLFAIEQGMGVIICDLTGGQGGDAEKRAPLSLLQQLENTVTRLEIIGPLVAFDHAAGRDSGRPVGCNIVLDDRPANLDYCNITALRAFLQHLASRCPTMHVDFGWTPDQTRPSRYYIETLKQFNTGFVWHGLLHHIDHRALVNPELDFVHGRRLVNRIAERYQVRFQPVMVFPYEKDTDDCVRLLKRVGFIAKAETLDGKTAAPAERTETGIRQPETAGDEASDGFVVLRRDSVETLSRDRMLARAALGMPIIAAAHPRDAGLRRFAKMRRQTGAVGNFDEVLDFVVEKELRPQSLEELARDTLAASADSA
jgi:hypothetical protein